MLSISELRIKYKAEEMTMNAWKEACPKTLREVQEMLPNGYDSIAVEIVGKCNAKCKYCPADKIVKCGIEDSDFITPAFYEEILKKLIAYKFLQKNTAFHIYCLGEPCLHPKLNEILKITAKYSIRTSLSTNASKVPDIDKEGIEGISRVLISVPGFSQESYDRIHGFSFEKIKENIVTIKKNFDELSNGRIPFDMSYHIYQFNQNEMPAAMKFCEEHGIRFAPNYAVLMDKHKCMQYVTGEMPYEELKDISKELFLGVLDHQIAVSPRNYCDFKERFLSITEKGELKICTAFTKEYSDKIICGNIVYDPIDEIIEKKYSHEYCKACIAAGLTLARGYDCKVYPDYYYSMMKENAFLKEAIHKSAEENGVDILAKELAFMHAIRSWEEAYDEADIEHLQCMIAGVTLKRAEEIIKKYCRFPASTWEKLSSIIKAV